jgi:hypothetical protein
MERERDIIGSGCSYEKRCRDPNFPKNMWALQVLGSQRNEGSSDISSNASKLLGI